MDRRARRQKIAEKPVQSSQRDAEGFIKLNPRACTSLRVATGVHADTPQRSVAFHAASWTLTSRRLPIVRKA